MGDFDISIGTIEFGSLAPITMPAIQAPDVDTAADLTASAFLDRTSQLPSDQFSAAKKALLDSVPDEKIPDNRLDAEIIAKQLYAGKKIDTNKLSPEVQAELPKQVAEESQNTLKQQITQNEKAIADKKAELEPAERKLAIDKEALGAKQKDLAQKEETLKRVQAATLKRADTKLAEITERNNPQAATAKNLMDKMTNGGEPFGGPLTKDNFKARLDAYDAYIKGQYGNDPAAQYSLRFAATQELAKNSKVTEIVAGKNHDPDNQKAFNDLVTRNGQALKINQGGLLTGTSLEVTGRLNSYEEVLKGDRTYQDLKMQETKALEERNIAKPIAQHAETKYKEQEAKVTQKQAELKTLESNLEVRKKLLAEVDAKATAIIESDDSVDKKIQDTLALKKSIPQDAGQLDSKIQNLKAEEDAKLAQAEKTQQDAERAKLQPEFDRLKAIPNKSGLDIAQEAKSFASDLADKAKANGGKLQAADLAAMNQKMDDKGLSLAQRHQIIQSISSIDSFSSYLAKDEANAKVFNEFIGQHYGIQVASTGKGNNLQVIGDGKKPLLASDTNNYQDLGKKTKNDLSGLDQKVREDAIKLMSRIDLNNKENAEMWVKLFQGLNETIARMLFNRYPPQNGQGGYLDKEQRMVLYQQLRASFNHDHGGVNARLGMTNTRAAAAMAVAGQQYAGSA
jgi:hypothetical protein